MKEIYGKSVTDVLQDIWNAKLKLFNEKQRLYLWKKENGYKYMTKKRWEQWVQQNLN